jgi:hypothetical protein
MEKKEQSAREQDRDDKRGPQSHLDELNVQLVIPNDSLNPCVGEFEKALCILFSVNEPNESKKQKRNYPNRKASKRC